MIRILVLALLAANLLYWGWSHWVREETPRLVTPPPSAFAAPATPPPPPPCATIGPIAVETRAMEIEQLLRNLLLEPRRRTVTADVPDGWWVYLVHPDAAAQARTLRTIRAAGVRDAFAMADDPEFRISVGLFREESRARIQATAVRAMGFEPSVGERQRQQETWWFDLPGRAAEDVSLQPLVDEGVDTSDLVVRACDPEPAVVMAPAVTDAAAAPTQP